MIEEVLESLGLGKGYFSKKESTAFEIMTDGICKSRVDCSKRVKLPKEFWDLMEDYPGSCSIQECFREWCLNNSFAPDGLSMLKRGGYLVMSEQIFRSLFAACINGTINILEGLVDKVGQDLDYLLLIGGFARCPFLHEAIEEFCRDKSITLYTPETPRSDLAVVHGAVYFGRDPCWISSRIARFTLGVIASGQFHASKHDGSQMRMINGSQYVEILYHFVERGDRIQVDGEVHKVLYPMSGRHYSIEFPIENTNKTGLIYSDDESLIRVGYLNMMSNSRTFKETDPFAAKHTPL